MGLFRTSSFFSQNWILRIIGLPVRIFYYVVVRMFIGFDVPDTVVIGKRFNVYHGLGIVIHKDVLIGDNVTIRQNVTIGNSSSASDVPVIADYVEIGAGAIIIGDVRIGQGAIIGAGTVVTKNVKQNTVVVGYGVREI